MSTTPTTPSLGPIVSAIVAFLANRNVHKLGGTALGAFGLVVTNKVDLIAGLAYAGVMHLTGGIKKVID